MMRFSAAQRGNVALADADGIGGLFLGALHAVHQAGAAP